MLRYDGQSLSQFSMLLPRSRRCISKTACQDTPSDAISCSTQVRGISRLQYLWKTPLAWRRPRSCRCCTTLYHIIWHTNRCLSYKNSPVLDLWSYSSNNYSTKPQSVHRRCSTPCLSWTNYNLPWTPITRSEPTLLVGPTRSCHRWIPQCQKVLRYCVQLATRSPWNPTTVPPTRLAYDSHPERWTHSSTHLGPTFPCQHMLLGSLHYWW